MIKGIAHVAFDVFDMEKSLNFYENILGMKRVFQIRDDDDNPWIEYLKACEGQFVELFYNRKEEKISGSYSHLCLIVDDIHDIAKHLEDNGVVLDVKPNQGKDNNWQCWVKDPDGNRIEFMQYSQDALQLNC